MKQYVSGHKEICFEMLGPPEKGFEKFLGFKQSEYEHESQNEFAVSEGETHGGVNEQAAAGELQRHKVCLLIPTVADGR